MKQFMNMGRIYMKFMDVLRIRVKLPTSGNRICSQDWYQTGQYINCMRVTIIVTKVKLTFCQTYAN